MDAKTMQLKTVLWIIFGIISVITVLFACLFAAHIAKCLKCDEENCELVANLSDGDQSDDDNGYESFIYIGGFSTFCQNKDGQDTHSCVCTSGAEIECLDYMDMKKCKAAIGEIVVTVLLAICLCVLGCFIFSGKAILLVPVNVPGKLVVNKNVKTNNVQMGTATYT